MAGYGGRKIAVLLVLAFLVGENARAVDAPAATPEETHGNVVAAQQREAPVRIDERTVGSAQVRQNPNKEGTYLVWTLAELHKEPLGVNDFTIAGVGLGASAGEIVSKFGAPVRIEKGNLQDYYQFSQGAALIQKGLPYDASIAQKIGVVPFRTEAGAVRLRTDTETLPGGRGLAVGNSRENILRVYGRPAEMRFAEDTATTYYLYRKEESDAQLVFSVRELQIQSILLERIPVSEAAKAPREDAFFGFRPGAVFAQPEWTGWMAHSDQKNVEAWLFRDFGVTLDKKSRKIRRVYLLSPHVTTPRGIALGDSRSTLEHVYGRPQLEEKGGQGEPDLVYYRLAAKPDVYLAAALDPDRSEILDLVLTADYIDDVSTREGRYGLETSDE